MMIKKSIFIFLLLLSINGCVERGLNLPHKVVHTKNNNTTDMKPYYALKLNAKDSNHDTLKNNISGSILLLIGLVILL